MKNKRGFGERVVVVAAAARVSGQAVIEQGFFGFAETDALITTRYALDISTSEHEVAFLTGAVKGQLVYCDPSNNLTLTSAGNRLAAKVSAVPGDGIYNDATKEPKTGKMWIITLPQSA